MEWIEKIPIYKSGKPAWAKENRLTQVNDVFDLTGTPFDPRLTKLFVLRGKPDVGKVSGLLNHESPNGKVLYALNDMFRRSTDKDLTMINKTSFMFNGFCFYAPIIPDTFNMSWMCLFERVFCRSIKVNQFD